MKGGQRAGLEKSGRSGLYARALWTARHLVFGSFVGAYRARRGLGHPKIPAAWDADYRAGYWEYLDGLNERSRNMVVLGYLAGLEGPASWTSGAAPGACWNWE